MLDFCPCDLCSLKKLSVHKEYRYWVRRGWFYDPAEDGPEVGAIRSELRARVADLLAACGFKDPRKYVA